MRKSAVAITLSLCLLGFNVQAKGASEPQPDPHDSMGLAAETEGAKGGFPFLHDADVDGDGVVTRAEITRYARNFWDYAYENSKWEWASWFRVVDAPMRETISIAERIRLEERFRKRADADGNGSITDAELETYFRSNRLPNELLPYAKKFVIGLPSSKDAQDPSDDAKNESLVSAGEMFAKGSRLRNELEGNMIGLWQDMAIGEVVKLDGEK